MINEHPDVQEQYSCGRYINGSHWVSLNCDDDDDDDDDDYNWKHHTIIQKIPEQHNWKEQHQGTTENNHIGHCAQCGNKKVKAKSVPLQARGAQRVPGS